MKVYDAPNIRNVALVGHGGCGKTSLASAMLFDAGAVNRLGRVDDGTTVTDFDPDEIERKISLLATLAFAEWKKAKVNLIDTPGYANFLSEARSALRVADAALVVVDAVAGVEVQTEKVWGYAGEYGLARLIVVNRMDRENASFERTLESVQAAFGRAAVAVAIPVGEEKGFQGIVDLVTEKASRLRRRRERQVPGRRRPRGRRRRRRRPAREAGGDGGREQRGAHGGVLREGHPRPRSSSRRGCARRWWHGQVFPVHSRLRDAQRGRARGPRRDRGPPALARGPGRGQGHRPRHEGRGVAAAGRRRAALGLRVQDPGRPARRPHLHLPRLLGHAQGGLRRSTTPARDAAERVGSLLLLQGKTQTQVPEVQAGDIAAVAKLKDTQTGDTLADKSSPIVYPAVVFPEPATTFAIEPKTRGDDDKISTALQRLLEEDPVLRVSRDAQTHEMLLSGMGQLHIEVVVGRLRKRYKVEVNLKKPKIPYRETIKAAAEGHGRHKKQTGGHGQFGDCRIRMKPLARGRGLQVRRRHLRRVRSPRTSSPRWRRASRTPASRASSPATRWWTSRSSSTTASTTTWTARRCPSRSRARSPSRTRSRSAGPPCSSPIMRVEIAVPDEYAGAVMGDLSSRRGRPQGMEPKGTLQVIKAEVPLAEMLSYDAELTSMTGGRGSYHMEMDHYDEVPGHLQDKIVAAARTEKGDGQGGGVAPRRAFGKCARLSP